MKCLQGHGKTLISDQFNGQVIEVDYAGNIVFTQGQIAVSVNGFNQPNRPYDSKAIGDYTGLTVPPSRAGVTVSPGER